MKDRVKLTQAAIITALAIVLSEAGRNKEKTLDPIDYTVHRILQARILEWVAIPFSRGSSQTRD